MNFKKVTICLDMHGCPNRCRHCWLGCTPNGNMSDSDLEYVAEIFSPYAKHLEVCDWYREPDYADSYKTRWELCEKLSDKSISHKHFELVSVWRIVRDVEYVKWLSSLGLQKAQLTIFGNEEITDYYTARKGAYQEILKAIDILIANRISPRLQMFINKNTINQLSYVENLIKELDLEKRCQSFGGEFTFFVHQGSCDGENEKLYDVRVTLDDLQKIPETLRNYTLKSFNKKHITEVFGRTEQSLYEELITDNVTFSYVSDSPVFYIDKNFNVYPNITTPSWFWCLGNLKQDGVKAVLENYTKNQSTAQHIQYTTPLCEIVKSQGNQQSQRLFSREDYISFLLNQYCSKRIINE